ncbi:MAG: SIS domain-containing protein [Nitrospirota bacterium]
MEQMRKIVKRSFRESIEAKQRCLDENAEALIKAATMIAEAFDGENKLMIFGNGGSAADAQHIASEFVNRFMIERPPLPALALTTDTSILTSVGNDVHYQFSHVFSTQLKALGVEGDVAWAISTSGTSANVVKALEVARERGLRTIAMTGRGGGKLAEMADILLAVHARMTPRIQECHITMGHIICELVDYQLFQRIAST